MYSNSEKAGGGSHDRERRSKTAAAVSVHIKDWPKSEEADSKQSAGARQAKARPGVNSVLNKIDPSIKDCRGSCKKENTDSKVIGSNRHFGLEKASSTGRDKKMNGTSSTSIKPRIGDSGPSKIDWPKSICFINNDDKFVAFGPGLPPGPHLWHCRYRWCSVNGHKHPPTEEKSLFQRRKRLGNQTSTPLNNSSLQTSIRRQYRKGSKTVLEYSSSVNVKPICNYDEDTDLIDLLRCRDISFIENFAKGKEETSSSGNSDVECEQTVMEVDDDQLRNCSSSVSTEADDNIDKYTCGFFPTATLEEAAEDDQKSFHELDLAQDEKPSGRHSSCFINRDEEDRALINLSSCNNGPDLAGNGRDGHSRSECSPEDIDDKQSVMKESDGPLNCSTLVVAEVESDEHGCSCSLPTSIKLEEAEDGQDNLCEPSVHSATIGDEDTISISLLIFPDSHSCDSESSLVGNTANGDEQCPSDCFPEHIGDMEDKHASVKQEEEDGLLNCRNPVVEEVDNAHEHGSSHLPTSMRLEEADDGQNISREQSSSTEDLAQDEDPVGIPVPSTAIGDEDSTLIFLLSLPDSHSCDREPSSPIGITADADDELSHSDFSPEDIGYIEDAHTAVKLEDDDQLLSCTIPVVAEVDSEREHECGSVPTLMTLEEAENGQNKSHEQSSWTEDLAQSGELNGTTVPSTTVGGEDITLIFLLSHSCDNEPSPIGNATDADENSHNDCSPEDTEDMEDTHIAVKLEEDDGLLNCSTPVAEKADNDHEHGCSSFPFSIRLEEPEDEQNVCELSVVAVDLVQDEGPNGSPVYSATIGDEDTNSIDLLSLPDSCSCGNEPSLVWHDRNADEDNCSDCALEHNGDIEDKHAAVKQEEEDGLLNCRIPVVAKVGNDNELGCSSLPIVTRPEEAENGQNNSHEQSSWTEDLAQGGESNGTPVLSITIGDEDTTLIYLLSLPDSHSCGNESSLIGNTTNTDEHSHSDCSPESIRDIEDNYTAVELEEGGQLSWGIPIVAEAENDEHDCSSSFSTSILEDAKAGQNNSPIEQSSWTEDNSVQGGESNGTPVPSTTIGGEDTLLVDSSSLYDSHSCGAAAGPFSVGSNATNTDEHSHNDCSLEGMEGKQKAALKEGEEEEKEEEEEEEEEGQNNFHHKDLGQPNDSHAISATFGDGPDRSPCNAGNADAQYNHSESSTVVDIRGIKDIKQGGVRRGSAANGLLLSCRSMPKLGAELEVHNDQAPKGAKNAHPNHCHNSLVRSYTAGAEILADYYCAAASDCQSGAGGVIKRSGGGWHRKRQGYGKIREEEAETVNLRHGVLDDRRLAEDYMIDFALVHAIRRLTGARKETGVKVLISAFETVVADKNHQAAPRPPFYIPRKNNACHHLPQLLSVVLQC